jgi:transcriptional regulator with XRE-family HTH domain
MQVGETIRQVREGRGWTQARLAKEAQITQAALSQLELGRRSPMMTTLIAIADALNVTLDALAGRHVAGSAQHYVALVNGHDSKTWYAAGIAALEDDGRIRLTLPLLARRTLLLRPVADASEAEAWPFRVTEREAWPKPEG